MAVEKELDKLSLAEQAVKFKIDVLNLAKDQSDMLKYLANKDVNERAMRMALGTARRESLLQGRQLVVEPHLTKFAKVHALEKSGHGPRVYRDWAKVHTARNNGEVYHITFADCHKMGRMSDDELHNLIKDMSTVITASPQNSVGIIVLPTMTSMRRKRVFSGPSYTGRAVVVGTRRGQQRSCHVDVVDMLCLIVLFHCSFCVLACLFACSCVCLGGIVAGLLLSFLLLLVLLSSSLLLLLLYLLLLRLLSLLLLSLLSVRACAWVCVRACACVCILCDRCVHVFGCISCEGVCMGMHTCVRVCVCEGMCCCH